MTTLDLHPSISHEACVLLLPWYVNQTLDDEEAVLVQTHLQDCPACRRELAELSGLAAQIVSEPVSGWVRGRTVPPVSKHLPSSVPVSVAGALGRRRRFMPRNPSSMVRYATAAAVLLVALPLGVRQLQIWLAADYRTLANPSLATAPAGDLRLVCARDLSRERIQALVREVDGYIVDGPNSAGAYTVRLGQAGKPGDLAAALAWLRGREGVVLAEPATSLR